LVVTTELFELRGGVTVLGPPTGLECVPVSEDAVSIGACIPDAVAPFALVAEVDPAVLVRVDALVDEG